MKQILLLGCCAFSLVCGGLANAETLTWDRNTEPDMQDYRIYACFTSGCVVVKSAQTLQATVAQAPVGVRPTYTIDLAGKVGSIAVSARDNATTPNESGLSVSVPFFDLAAPSIPVNPMLQ